MIMKTVNHEYYIDLEMAKLLEKASFDWEEHYPRNFCYINDNPELFDKSILKNYIEKDDVIYFAPTLEVVQRWLREVKKISVEVKTLRWVNRNQDGKYTVSYRHELWPIDTSIIPDGEDKFIRYTIDCACDIEFQTYEEAQESGIKKALEIILEKGE